MEHRDYMDEQQEYQERQYSPGYYTGGKVPPWFKKPGNTKRLGILLLLIGVFFDALLVINLMEPSAAQGNGAEVLFSTL